MVYKTIYTAVMIDFYFKLNLNVFADLSLKFKCNLKYFSSNISYLKLLVFLLHVILKVLY